MSYSQQFQEVKDVICSEIKVALSKIDGNELDAFIDYILKASKIFVVGLGRVMLMLQAFAKRLKHLGFETYVVGETTVPAIQEGDVLLVASGSGENLTTLNITRLAKKYKANIILITLSPRSTLRDLSDVSVRIPCSPKRYFSDETPSKQPMLTIFEQSILVFCDSIVMIIKEKLNVTEEEMWKVHSNLE